MTSRPSTPDPKAAKDRSTEMGRWLIFKRRACGGITAGWYALHESNGVGVFFPSGRGIEGWQAAVEFVARQARRAA